MPETTPNSKGPAPVQLTPETTEPALIPPDQVKPEDVGTLSIEYRDGQPVIVVSGGRYIPAGLTVVDGSGNAVAAYAVGVSTGRSLREPGLMGVNFMSDDGVVTDELVATAGGVRFIDYSGNA
ncbi:hypothetical protein [Kitasatospora sp. NPDC001095]